MVESTPRALSELLEIEEFLRERLASLNEAGDEARGPFVRALGEVQSLLSLGLKGLMRRQKLHPVPPSPAKNVRTVITRKRSRTRAPERELDRAEGEFVLEYRREAAALAVERVETPSVTPASRAPKLRLKGTTNDR